MAQRPLTADGSALSSRPAQPTLAKPPAAKPAESAKSLGVPGGSSLRRPAKPPPVIQPNMACKIPWNARQKMLGLFYEQYVRIFQPILDAMPDVAHEHAIKQEQDVMERSTPVTYSVKAAGTLRRLMSRPASTGVHDVGIDGKWQEPRPGSVATGGEAATARGASLPIQGLEALLMTEEQLKLFEFPLGPFPERAATGEMQAEPPVKCNRCGLDFVVKYPLDENDKVACAFHPGRWRMEVIDGVKERLVSCCNGAKGAQGCCRGPHVFKEEDNGLLNARIPFVKLPEHVAEAQPVVALDCEMSYTTGGMELTRVTVVDWAGNPLLDELCKTKHPMLDLNTRFSGVTTLEGARFDLDGVRAELAKFMSAQTIILGHGLENDMQQIEHRRIVDTVVVFPHPMGHPYRHALRVLAQKVLGRLVQTGSGGHDSLEDARTCIDLLQKRIEKGSQIDV
nr:RNA exonuclease 3 [Polyrhizophydium stewartii]